MSLNPGESSKADAARQAILDDHFNSGSPYHSMFRCGYYGVPLEDCIAKCQRNGIAIRRKDLQNYNNGAFKRGIGSIVGSNGLLTNIANVEPGTPFENTKLSDYPLLPVGWKGTEHRFFPCTQDNKPMQQWGWKKNPDGSVFSPELYTRSDARALSPCGWVGQNLLYQRFVVMDIDGRGHGADDLEVIAFGNMFRDKTFTVEDPRKPGSFHLYFATDRLLPDKHFPWAKLDFKGNARNSAVYFKNKVGNGVPMLTLTEEIWQAMIRYESNRKGR